MPIRVLFVTDLTYQARGRRYCDEDIHLSDALREHFTVSLCHPLDAASLMADADVVVVRNSGPVVHYEADYRRFRDEALSTGVKVFTELSGKGDQVGKGYLVELSAAGYPVIPTVDDAADIDRLPDAGTYVVKPRNGADSIGLRTVGRDDLPGTDLAGMLVQPRVAFEHEVSFYFVDRSFQYALFAPDPDVRWGLEPYEPTPADLAFAQRFVDWNDVDHGIQRVDACRTSDGDLLLVELEDLNPYLSLDLVDADRRAAFVAATADSIGRLAAR
ncbi:hypothetical protein GCM10023340_37630 [Nocardioides marinquilinus]|uniref:ATP-grasp domain-containing protein n=1 Tax=Nocardioides marinquilinus TaxID=1210400 RepID=A0ABP9Q2M6_9ACTN